MVSWQSIRGSAIWALEDAELSCIGSKLVRSSLDLFGRGVTYFFEGPKSPELYSMNAFTGWWGWHPDKPFVGVLFEHLRMLSYLVLAVNLLAVLLVYLRALGARQVFLCRVKITRTLFNECFIQELRMVSWQSIRGSAIWALEDAEISCVGSKLVSSSLGFFEGFGC